MEQSKRKILLIAYIFAMVMILSLISLYLLWFIEVTPESDKTMLYIYTGIFLIFAGLLSNEAYHWYKRGKRGDSADLILIGFLGITVFIVTNGDWMNSIIGALSIYLLVGIVELKEYEILNKILLITVITYNFVFIMGLVNSVLKTVGIVENDIIRDSAFSFSIWIMLILGFILFGRKYLVVFRFMSPEYLTMLLFLFAWLAVRGISLIFGQIELDIIYWVLIGTNWLVYFISGPILDLFLGIKKTENEQLNEIVEEVKTKLGIKDKVKVGFGKYPILNAFAYGAFFDKRIAIIADDVDSIPKDEIKGIIAHELNHIKGKHTLILSLISSLEILVFWALRWPVTYYDYVFNPAIGEKLPIELFFVINIVIMIFIYVFVRVLEAKADINTKKAGYGNELAKGLYNLEGFYASGREIGLDTMLLCEEKLLDYNRVTNYSATAEYLNEQMVNPGRLTLLSNLINSHPPSYHRIIAMYGDLNPWEESILPITLLRKKNKDIFAKKHSSSIKRYREMANNKFAEMFDIKDYGKYMNELRKKELFEIEIEKTYIYIDRLNFKLGIGRVSDIEFKNDVNEPAIYKIIPIDFDNQDEKLITELSSDKNMRKSYPKDLHNDFLGNNIKSLDNSSNISKIVELSGVTTKLIRFELGAWYYTKKNKKSQLIGVKLPEFSEVLISDDRDDFTAKREDFLKRIKKEAFYIFSDEDDIYLKRIKKYKLPFNLNLIEDSVGKVIFLEDNGTLKIFDVEKIEKGDSFWENVITLVQSSTKSEKKPTTKELRLNEIIIKKDEFSVSFHNDEATWDYESEILEFLKSKNCRTTMFLKKPINNQETGYVTRIDIDQENRKDESSITLMNIFGKEVSIPMQKIEAIIFSSETISVMEKDKMSLGEKFIQKISSWRKPNNTYNPII